MSATLDAEPVRGYLVEHLGDCPGVRSEGRLFPVEVELPGPAPDRRAPLADQVAGAVRRLLREGPPGDVLVFLPGAGEIRRAGEALAPLARPQDLLVLPLHGELPPAEQDRAVRPADRRKVILSTNVAETSVTIDGVVAVIDSGLARLAAHSPWSGLATLQTGQDQPGVGHPARGPRRPHPPGPGAAPVHPARLRQPPRPSSCPRWPARIWPSRCWRCTRWGCARPASWSWFEPPPAPALQAGEELLRRLGAVDGGGALTDVGPELLRFPAHPRLARLLLEGERRGVGPEAAARGGADRRAGHPRAVALPVSGRRRRPAGGGRRRSAGAAGCASNRRAATASRAIGCGRWIWTGARWRRSSGCAGSWPGPLRPAPGAARPRTPEAVDEALATPRWPPSPTG